MVNRGFRFVLCPWDQGTTRDEPARGDCGLERDQLAIDRLSRIWAIIEFVAEYPGTSRRKLAEKYALSERQVQEDLRVIREELRFPLIRRKGYRFSADEDHVAVDFSFSEARALISALRGAVRDRGIPQEPLRSLMAKLPTVFPLQLQPLIRKSLDSLQSPNPDLEEKVFLALTEALFEQSPVRLHMGVRGISGMQNPVIEPQLLMPYMGNWYLVGRCRQKKRVMMFKVDAIDAVTLASKI